MRKNQRKFDVNLNNILEKTWTFLVQKLKILYF